MLLRGRGGVEAVNPITAAAALARGDYSPTLRLILRELETYIGMGLPKGGRRRALKLASQIRKSLDKGVSGKDFLRLYVRYAVLIGGEDGGQGG